jgi:hypothetical protein
MTASFPRMVRGRNTVRDARALTVKFPCPKHYRNEIRLTIQIATAEIPVPPLPDTM